MKMKRSIKILYMNTFLYDLKSIFFPSNFYLVGVAPGERPYDPEDWNYVSRTYPHLSLQGSVSIF